jgi:hypothetical protein
MPPKLLTKTKYMNGLQCLKLLWLTVNDPRKLAAPSFATQKVFDQGQQVGELARQLFPAGIPVPQDDFMGNLLSTKKLLQENRPLFEAGFMVERMFCRVDVLNPVGHDRWDIIEVKSSTSIKDENLQDVSFQKYCCQRAGIEVNHCYLAHINNQYIKNGEIVAPEFFRVEDITEEVESTAKGIDERISRMFEVISSKSCPEALVSNHCTSPYDCPVRLCWEELPQNNILTLFRGGKKCFEFLNRGVLFMKDIPVDAKLSLMQQKQKWCDVNNKPFVNGTAIRSFLESLKTPLYFLDFETFSTAIPLYDGIRPYQKVPFQYSLHVCEDDEKRHFSFLAEGLSDPRPELMSNLRERLGEEGSIITYNQSFEQSVFKELSEAFPNQAEWVESVNSRLADLYAPFRNFDYYHPDQEGSASIKSVLPALTGRGYEDLAIKGGEEASAAYLEMIAGGLTSEEKEKIRSDLIRYCGLDTEGMIWIVDKLKEIC